MQGYVVSFSSSEPWLLSRGPLTPLPTLQPASLAYCVLSLYSTAKVTYDNSSYETKNDNKPHGKSERVITKTKLSLKQNENPADK